MFLLEKVDALAVKVEGVRLSALSGWTQLATFLDAFSPVLFLRAQIMATVGVKMTRGAWNQPSSNAYGAITHEGRGEPISL